VTAAAATRLDDILRDRKRLLEALTWLTSNVLEARATSHGQGEQGIVPNRLDQAIPRH
jgi:hypothetical protein